MMNFFGRINDNLRNMKGPVISFIENFLPSNRVVVVPLENSYIFAGYNELVLDALVAKNFGCNRLVNYKK